MLHLKIQKTVQLMEAVDENRRTVNNHNAIARKNTIFFNSLSLFTKDCESYLLARKLGFDLSETTGLTQEMKEIVGIIKTAFEIQAANDSQSFKTKVDKFNESISNCWTLFYHKKYDELLSGLLMAKSIYSDSTTVDSIISSIKKCEKWSLNKNNVDSLCEGEDKGYALLKSMEFDESIKDFLEKVITSTATLRDITPEIYQWIKKENLDDKIALTMKNR